MSEDDKHDNSEGNRQPETTSTEFYEVLPGDSLTKIARRVYGDANQWSRIFMANQDVLKGGRKIVPGQKLKIPR